MRLDVDGSGRFKPGSPVVREPLIHDYRVDLRNPQACGKPWPRNRRCRIPLHNSFFQWYAANEDKFAIKLELLKHAGTCFDIGFHGINPILTGHLDEDEISVSAVSEGMYWDTILDLDALPKQVPGGYRCDFCLEEQQRTFPSLEALWRDHLFEPFLQWVNDDLVKAEEISITGTPDWFGSARLVRRPR